MRRVILDQRDRCAEWARQRIAHVPSWGEWCDGDGVPIFGAAVTDAWGPGPFQIKGTPEGGPFVIYAGGVVPLSDTALLG